MGGPRAQGCSTRQAEAPGAQPRPLPCPGDSWELQEQGCGHGALALKQRNPAVSRGMSSSLCPTLLAIPRFGSFPSVSAELQGPAGGDLSSSFLPRAVFLPCLWQFCPGAAGGIPLSVWCLQSAPAKAVCALCQLPAASEPPKLLQTPPSSTERSEAASHQPFPQVFPSG